MNRPLPKLNILYEDNHVIVCEKPVNVPTQSDKSGDDDLLSQIKRYVQARYQKPGEAYIGLVHRLDRPVGGAMVFARTSKAAARLSAMLQDKGAGGIRRTYRAVAHGDFSQTEGTLTDWLVKDGRTHTSRVAKEGEPGAKKAILHYRVLAQREGYALLEIELETGRSHQIRVQLANAGHPLVGDQRYGAGGEPGIQIALWSFALSFLHPVKQERLSFSVPVPDKWPWTVFSGRDA